jgi:hypothetical protein
MKLFRDYQDKLNEEMNIAKEYAEVVSIDNATLNLEMMLESKRANEGIRMKYGDLHPDLLQLPHMDDDAAFFGGGDGSGGYPGNGVGNEWGYDAQGASVTFQLDAEGNIVETDASVANGSIDTDAQEERLNQAHNWREFVAVHDSLRISGADWKVQSEQEFRARFGGKHQYDKEFLTEKDLEKVGNGYKERLMSYHKVAVEPPAETEASSLPGDADGDGSQASGAQGGEGKDEDKNDTLNTGPENAPKRRVFDGVSTASDLDSLMEELHTNPRFHVGPNHIILDRPWVLPDVYDVPVYKLVKPVFYVRPFKKILKLLNSTYPAQKAAAVSAITCHKLSNFFEYCAEEYFDDDSELAERLRIAGYSLEKRKNANLKRSYSVVEMSYDFELRRQVWAFSKTNFMRSSKYVLRKLKMTESTKGQEDGSVEGGGFDTGGFDKWTRSDTKETVVVKIHFNHTLGDEEDAEVLGPLSLDLEAPMEVLRDMIYRAFREPLNKSVGSSFIFVVRTSMGKTQRLIKKKEKTTKAKEYTAYYVVPSTRESHIHVMLVPDGNGFEEIPDYSNARKRRKKRKAKTSVR